MFQINMPIEAYGRAVVNPHVPPYYPYSVQEPTFTVEHHANRGLRTRGRKPPVICGVKTGLM